MVYPKIKIVIFVGVLLFQIFGVSAQQNIYHAYSETELLPSNIIHAMTQDSDGKYWFVSQNGVMTYDGISWDTFPDTLGLPNTEFSIISTFSDGSIIIVGKNTYNKKVACTFKNNTWNILDLPGEVTTLDRFHAFEDDSGINIFHSSANDLYFYNSNDKVWKSKLNLMGISYIEPIRQILHHNDQLLVVSFTSVLGFDKNLEPIEDYKVPGLSDYRLHWLYISADEDTIIGIAPEKLLIKIKEFPVKEVNSPQTTISSTITYGKIQINKGTIYYTSTGPLYMYDLKRGTQRQLTGHGDPLLPMWTDFFLDKNNVVWVVNLRGISKINSTNFELYSTIHGLSEDEITSIEHLPNDFHFLGHNRGFTVFKGNEVYWIYRFESKLSTRIQEVTMYNDHTLYAAASTNGLLKINIKNKTVKSIPTPGFAGVFSVNYFSDSIYFNGYTDVGILYKEKLINSKKVGTARRIFKTKSGLPILMSRLGLIIDPFGEDIVLNSTSDDFNIFSLAYHKDSLLMATMGGLFSYVNGETKSYPIDNQFVQRGVYSLLSDSYGNLWVGTSEGVYQINNHKIINHFTSLYGLMGNESNRDALSEDKEGRIWIGTNRGLTILDPRTLNGVNTKLNPFVKSLYSGNKELNPLEINKLKFSNNEIEFVLGAYHFIDEKNLVFSYRLAGLEESWVEIPSIELSKVRYNFLTPGEYTFEFKVKESLGPWSETYQTHPIIILKPFYFQYWFILIILTGTIFFITLLVRFFVIRRSKNKLEHLLNLKMKEVLAYQGELENRNSELQTTNTELDTLVYSISHDLRAPVLSSLGLVNIYDLTNDPEEKSKYIGLIRKSMERLDGFIQNILKISRNARLEINNSEFNPKILLEEIIDSQRHREEAANIKFEINCAIETISTDQERLTMIMTNLISNAIIYSDVKKEQSVIRVNCKMEDDLLKISVYDNGVGIHPNYINDIFKIFVRANEVKSGSGLGLYITHQTALKLGAELSVNSEYGKWTEFSILFYQGTKN